MGSDTQIDREGVTVGQSEYATAKGQFVTDKVDDMLMKSEQRSQRSNSKSGIDAKTRKNEAANTVKPSPRGDYDASPAGSATQLLAADVLNNPIDESPTKTRAASEKGKQRPQKQANSGSSPYLQHTVIKGPSPRGGGKGQNSNQYL